MSDGNEATERTMYIFECVDRAVNEWKRKDTQIPVATVKNGALVRGTHMTDLHSKMWVELYNALVETKLDHDWKWYNVSRVGTKTQLKEVRMEWGQVAEGHPLPHLQCVRLWLPPFEESDLNTRTNRRLRLMPVYAVKDTRLDHRWGVFVEERDDQQGFRGLNHYVCSLNNRGYNPVIPDAMYKEFTDMLYPPESRHDKLWKVPVPHHGAQEAQEFTDWLKNPALPKW